MTQGLLDEFYRNREMPGAKEAMVNVIRNTINLSGVRKEYVLPDKLAGLDVPVMLVWGGTGPDPACHPRLPCPAGGGAGPPPRLRPVRPLTPDGEGVRVQRRRRRVFVRPVAVHSLLSHT